MNTVSQANSLCSQDDATVRGSEQHVDPLFKRCWKSVLRAVANLYWLAIIQVEVWEIGLRLDIIRRLCFRVYSYCVQLPLPLPLGRR